MANVAHSTLTGSNLHENKGVAAAANNTVATASSGTTVWQKINANHISANVNPFASQFMHVRDIGDLYIPVNQWWIRPINTVQYNSIGSASLSDDIIILPAGNYHIRAQLNSSCAGNYSNTDNKRPSTIAELRDLTGAQTVLYSNTANAGGTSIISASGSGVTGNSNNTWVNTPFSIAMEGRVSTGGIGRAYVIRQYCTWFDHYSTTIGADAPAINTQVYIWKLD